MVIVVILFLSIFNFRFENDDPWLKNLVQEFDKLNEDLGSGSLVDVFPILSYFPNPVLNKTKRLMSEISEFILGAINDHRKTFDPGLFQEALFVQKSIRHHSYGIFNNM